jgi:pyruvate carboxylase subunit B
MAGIGRPETLGKICAGINAYKKDIVIQYHSHAGPGLNMASILEVCENGCDYIDTAVAPLSCGTGRADILAVQAMLKDAGFKVKEINMSAYMEVRTQVQEMMDDFLGYYCNPLNRINNSLLIAPGLPGGMMGSLMADLETNLTSLNKWKAKHGQAELSEDDLLVKLFDEVAYIWPKVGYPCLVTPFSQYVKNLALMNVIQMEKGKERWSMIADDIWDMILGKAGRLPGEIAPEIKALAEEQGRVFSDTDPQENYPDELDKYKKLMEEKGWELGEDDEELFEYAMHPSQYEAYKSGKAKEDFLNDLAKRREEANAPSTGNSQPESVTVTVNGQSYKVDITYGDVPVQENAVSTNVATTGEGEDIIAPLEGKFYLTKSTQETPKKVGDKVVAGDTIAYIEAMKTYNAIRAEFDGVITAIIANPGDTVEEDDVIIKIAK